MAEFFEKSSQDNEYNEYNELLALSFKPQSTSDGA